jgi:hypothetical protein
LVISRRAVRGQRLVLAAAMLAFPASLEAQSTWRDSTDTPVQRSATRPPLPGPLDIGGPGEVIDNAATPPRLTQDALDLQTRSNLVQGAGARAYGMGGAFLARPDDATAASWNPAGLSYLRSPEFSLVWARNSLSLVTRDATGSVDCPVCRIDERAGSSPDFLAATLPVRLGSRQGSAQVSFQRAISFDSDRTIDATTLRQFSSRGGFDVFAIGSGLQVSRQWRLGLTLNRWFNGYEQTLQRTFGPNSNQKVTFDFSGWNFNMGAIWSPVDSLNLGAVFKNPFTAKVKMQRARIDYTPDGTVVSSNSAARSDLEVDFPGAFGVGVSWRPISTLTASMDYTLTNWSGGKVRNYFTLPPTGVPAAPDDFFPELPYPSLIEPPSGQQDTEQIRVGAEYVLIWRRVKWPLRAGWFADRQLFVATDGRRPTFQGVTAGTGVIAGKVLVDFAYLYEFGSYFESAGSAGPPLPTATLRSHRFFLSFIYRHRR